MMDKNNILKEIEWLFDEMYPLCGVVYDGKVLKNLFIYDCLKLCSLLYIMANNEVRDEIEHTVNTCLGIDKPQEAILSMIDGDRAKYLIDDIFERIPFSVGMLYAAWKEYHRDYIPEGERDAFELLDLCSDYHEGVEWRLIHADKGRAIRKYCELLFVAILGLFIDSIRLHEDEVYNLYTFYYIFIMYECIVATRLDKSLPIYDMGIDFIREEANGNRIGSSLMHDLLHEVKINELPSYENIEGVDAKSIYDEVMDGILNGRFEDIINKSKDQGVDWKYNRYNYPRIWICNARKVEMIISGEDLGFDERDYSHSVIEMFTTDCYIYSEEFCKTSWQDSNEDSIKLAYILFNYPNIWLDSRRFKAVLSDYYREKKIRNLLNACLEEHIPHELSEMTSYPDKKERYNMKKRIFDSYAYSEKDINYVFDLWVWAFGLWRGECFEYLLYEE